MLSVPGKNGLLIWAQENSKTDEKILEERQKLLSPILKASSNKDLIDFGDQIFAEKDYYNALTIYKYALFRAHSEKQKESIRFRIGLCYQMGEKWDEAEHAFDEFIGYHSQSSKVPEASYRIGQGYFRAQDYLRAINHFRETTKQFPDSEYAVRSQYATGLGYARLGKWDLSLKELNQLADKHPQHHFAAKSRSLAILMEEGKNIPRKSPTLAGVLSIIPGLGKVYTSHYGGAIIALIVNGGLGFVIYDSFDNDRYAVGAIFSTLAAATYGANIVGGYRSAKRYNARQEDQFAEKITSQGYVPELELD
jgi:tetratricopeptide (TPR) repeat protein